MPKIVLAAALFLAFASVAKAGGVAESADRTESSAAPASNPVAIPQDCQSASTDKGNFYNRRPSSDSCNTSAPEQVVAPISNDLLKDTVQSLSNDAATSNFDVRSAPNKN